MNKKTIPKALLSALSMIFVSSLSASSEEFSPVETVPKASLYEAVFHASPSDAREMFNAYKQMNKASAPSLPSPLQMKRSIKRVNLGAEGKPPLLHIVKGYITNIQFNGENGAPWAVMNVVSGNEENLVAKGGTKESPYNVTLQAINPSASTNVAVYLAGRNVPVMLYVETEADGTSGIDVMVTYLLDGYPPGTSAPDIINERKVSDALLNALDAYPGSSWSVVNVNENECPLGVKLWTHGNGESILRLSQGQLISPNWESSVHNSDGTVTSYQFSHTPLLLVVSDKGGRTYEVSVVDPALALTNTVIAPNPKAVHATVQEF